MYFDRRTTRVLLFIYMSRDHGVSWGTLHKVFKKTANIFLLETLTNEGYTVTCDRPKHSITFTEDNIHRDANYRSFCSTKGRAFLENRIFNFWKWTIPTIISVVALIVSVLGAQ